MKCEICKIGMPEGATLFRVNKPGEMPARWRCSTHLTITQNSEIDPQVREIVEIIGN